MNHGTTIGTGATGSGASWCMISISVDDLVGVVGADLRAEAVLQRRDETAAVGVVLGVGRRDHQHVELESHQVATDLHVALFEDVEQPHLDALGEVGQFVDREDAAIRLRHEAVAEGVGVVEVESARRP